MQPVGAPDLEYLSFFSHDDLMFDRRQQYAAGYPSQVSFGSTLSPHRIGLGHLFETGGTVLDLLEDHVAQGIGDPATEHRGIDKDLADMIELVRRLGQQLYQELAATGPERT